jgi:hypothetical protein
MSSVISRVEWNADKVALEPMPLVPVKTVVLHHTATTASSDGAKDMRNIEAGEQARGYTTVAYHEVGHPNGLVYEGRGVTHKGAATLGRNSDTLAYSFIGNFQTEQPTAIALEACAQRLAEWVRQGRATKDFKLKPHSDFFATACCGTNLKPKISSIRSRVDEILKENKPQGVPVASFETYSASVGVDDQGRGYVDVYHSKGADPKIAIATVNGTDNKNGYPQIGEPVFATASFQGAFVRVTVLGATPRASFGFKLLMGW